MTKQEKIAVLRKAMTTRLSRDGESTEYVFSPDAPEELKALFLEHYEVRNIDYETFSQACDLVSEIYEGNSRISADKAEDEIYERANECGSVYTATRLEYLNIWNQDEIADIVRDTHTDIGTACAIWFDKRVEQAAIIIKDWINA